MRKNKIYLVIALLLFSLVLSACGNKESNPQSATENPYPGTAESDMVTVDIQTEPLTLNSMINSDSVTMTILQMGLTGLMKLDGDGKPIPGIAEKFDLSDDKKTYTFHLRKDATWSNGEPVTTKDFIFAWNEMLKPEVAASGAFSLCRNIVNAQEVYDGTMTSDMLGVKAIDDYTLTVELIDPIPYALELFAQTSLFPINQKSYEKIGPDNYGTDADKIVTNGAYRIAEWTHDSSILMEKNDAYFNADSIHVPKVKYVMLADENARINAFKSGQLDMFDVFGSQIDLLNKEGKDIIKAYYDNTVFSLQFNKGRGVTANPKICQALTMAIDTQNLCDGVFLDGSIPADGMVPPTISGANEKSFAESRGDLITYDKEQAKKLLEEGLKELQMNKDSLNLTYTANNSSIGKLQAEYFQQQWEQNLGIKVEISLMDWSPLLETLANGNFDFTINGWNDGVDDPFGYLNVFVSDNENNFGKYQSPEYDALLAQAKQETDPNKRQEYLIKAEKMLVEDGVSGALYNTRIVYASSAKVQDVACVGYQKYDFTAGAKIVN